MSQGTQVLQTRVPCKKYFNCLALEIQLHSTQGNQHKKKRCKLFGIGNPTTLYSRQSAQKKRYKFTGKAKDRVGTNHIVYTMPSQPIIQKSEKMVLDSAG